MAKEGSDGDHTMERATWWSLSQIMTESSKSTIHKIQFINSGFLYHYRRILLFFFSSFFFFSI